MAYQVRAVATGSAFSLEDNGVWTMADVNGDGSPDLVYIKTKNTGNGKIEVHAASHESRFQEHSLATGTVFRIEDNGTWLMCDWTGDGKADLVYLKTRNTGTKKVEVHVADAASNYQKFVLQTGTCFAMEENGIWSMSSKGDLVYVKTRATGSGKIEIHIASKSSNYQSFIRHVATDFAVEDNGTWCLAQGPNASLPDLYYIKTRNTGTNMVEVHAVSAQSEWKRRVIDVGTGFAKEDNGRWLMVNLSQDWPDLVYIKTRSTGTQKIEVHVNQYHPDPVEASPPAPQTSTDAAPVNPPEVDSAREAYISHLEDFLQLHEESKLKFGQLEASSRVATSRLEEIYNKLDDHLTKGKVASTAGNVTSAIGTVLLFTPAAILGMALIGAGVVTSVGTAAAESLIFEADATKAFTQVMNNYGIASRDLEDLYKRIEKAKEDLIESLKLFLAILEAHNPSRPGTSIPGPGIPTLPSGPPGSLPPTDTNFVPNQFTSVAIQTLFNSAAAAQSLPAGSKTIAGLFETIAKGSGKQVTKFLPMLGEVVPFLGIAFDLAAIIQTWTNNNETLGQIARLRTQILENVETLRRGLQTSLLSLEDMIGDETIQDSLRKLLRFRKPSQDPPGGPGSRSILACRVLGTMQQLPKTPLMVFARLLGKEQSDAEDNEYSVEMMPTAHVTKLSQMPLTASVIDQAYERYPGRPEPTDTESLTPPLRIMQMVPLAGTQAFRDTCEWVEFGGEAVFNVSGSMNDNRVSSWVRYWYWFYKNVQKGRCAWPSCKIIGGWWRQPHSWLGRPVVGGHMEKVDRRDRSWYILPICSRHNAPAGTYDRGGPGGSLTTHDNAYAVKIPRA
ncbi:putative FG-GAP repeat protein [Fusarium bulbicola]|nr:putative FG-GAP repeat protein [Fusarium bulbicola]